MFYCDFNLFIRPAISSDEKAVTARKILEALAEHRIEGLTSSLTVDEVIWIVWKVLVKKQRSNRPNESWSFQTSRSSTRVFWM